MDILGNFVQNTELTVKNVRSLVDDYSLLSYYLNQELDLHTKYSSPLREGDENPSFSIFYGYGNLDPNKLYFKDQIGIAQGDVYEFLRIYLNAKTIQDLLEQINFDLNLGLNCNEKNKNLVPTILKKIPIHKERPKINIVSQPFTKNFINYWWGKYQITNFYLNYYNVKCVRDIHYEYDKSVKIIVPKSLCISYTIGKYYKLYMPFENKTNKFRNDYPQNYVEGHQQLNWKRNDLLIISKAMKECILFRQHWNIQAVAGKSETTIIPDFLMQQYLKHFKRVVLWLDPDEAGIRSTEKYLNSYPQLQTVIHSSDIPNKDITDIFEIQKLQKTTEIVKHYLSI